MKRILILGIGALTLIGSPAVAQEEDEWTGPYVGIQGGYTQARSATNVTLGGAWTGETAALRDFFASNFAARQRDDDFNIGAQIGYNYQTGPIVVGVEGEFTVLNGSQTISRGPLRYPASTTLAYSYTNTVDPKHMYGIKAKLGAAAGKTLFYAEGGWAWTRVGMGATASSSANYLKGVEIDTTRDGYIVGGGVEHRFSDNLSARLSYDYTDQGKASYVSGYRPGSAFIAAVYTETFRQDLRLHMVRAGVNYRF